MSLSDDLVVTQKMAQEKDAIYILVDIENSSDFSWLVQTVPPVRERALGQEFLISAEGKNIPYIGAMAKLKPLQQSDFYELKSGSKEARKIRIDLDYGLLSGTHTYEISYTYLVYNAVTEKVEARLSPKTSLNISR
ncbi:MAG: hypothetical protein QM709_01550 [Spongiibacteraceae bacterium]